MSNVAVLGTGSVGLAFIAALNGSPFRTSFPIVQISNSRACSRIPVGGFCGSRLQSLIDAVAEPRSSQSAPEIGDDISAVVDATSSDYVAGLHATWLRRGISVITANKRGLGEDCERAEQIESAMRYAKYGDSATVGAGLGAIRRLRDLASGGRSVVKLEGILSGTMGWIFNHLDADRDFPELVREAHKLGYTEPDPRDDIGGIDTARKLRILARSAGWFVANESVHLDERLQPLAGIDLWADVDRIGKNVKAFVEECARKGQKAIVSAKGTPSGYHVGLEMILHSSELARRVDCDNVLAIWCAPDASRPLILRGPGAGAKATANALLRDLVTHESNS